MPIPPLVGHHEERTKISAAIRAGHLPQVILLTGPAGVGKQRLSLWIAARLFCAHEGDEPCGVCGPCRRVAGLAHPDLHWLVPVPRPKATEPDKQVEEVSEALEEVMAGRRLDGQWQAPDGMAIHGIASARWLQRHAAMTAVEGSWRVFVIGRAERLVPQESSTESANALLKLLEEPPVRSVFLLTAAEPGLVLPTIRSRAVPLRLGRLADEEVARFAADRGMTVEADAVRRAEGSIGRLIAQGDATRQKAGAAARAVRQAVTESSSARALLALRQPVAQARGEFTAMLDSLADLYRDEARGAAARAGGRGTARRSLDAIERVQVAREQAQGNVNPRLALGALAVDLSVLEQG